MNELKKTALTFDLKAAHEQATKQVEAIEDNIIHRITSLQLHGIAMKYADVSKVIILLSMGDYNTVLNFRMSYMNWLSAFTNDPTNFNRYAGFRFYNITCLPCAALADGEMKTVYDIAP